ncbi:MAG: Dihydroxy-acid dehydratase [Elusimicrobia bacterium]|nr:Dihydroxy-acid dehydratase [Elusimicrobiota bacterium]
MQNENRSSMSGGIRLKPEGALLRTYLQAAGVSPESLSKPLVGVVTVSTQIFSERPDAKELGNAVTLGVEISGGIAVRWDTVRSPDQMARGHAESYSFAWRDQLADFIESWSKQEALDGLVLVGDSHKTLVGMAMAAARLNLPAVIVTSGAPKIQAAQMEANSPAKKNHAGDPYSGLSEALFGIKHGNAAQERFFNECLKKLDEPSTHTMDLILEVLGLCLPGMSTAPALSPERHELATASGKRIVSLIQSGFSAKRVLSANSFVNAVRLNAALGGSIDVAVHLMALAHEAGVSLPIDMFDKIACETPHICRLSGVGLKEPHRIEDLDRAGGVWAIMHALKDQVAPATTVAGKGASELARSASIKDTHVILGNRPYAKQSGLAVLRGNLAPRGAVFLLNQVYPVLVNFHGTAAVFDSEIDAVRAVMEGKIKKAFAIVVRLQGPKGGPGLRKLRILPALLESRGLNKTMPLITDGRLPETPTGLFVSLVSPEAAVPGPLAVLRTGDPIEINTIGRTISVRLTEMELKIRQTRWQAPEPKSNKGFLGRYSRSVSEAHEGAVLK